MNVQSMKWKFWQSLRAKAAEALTGTLCSLAFGGLMVGGLVSPARAVITGENFIWGMNGHPTGGNYTSVPAATILSQLKGMGTTYYRIDLSVDTNGKVTDGGVENGPSQTAWTALYNAAPSYGVKFLVMLYMPYNLGGTWTSNYNTGYSIANNFCKNYPQVMAIEEGNEMDQSPFCTGGSDDGASIADYNAADCYLLAGMFTGMYNGAHAANSSVRCAIDCITHPHWGWFQVLQNDNVPWDITAVHWYSSSGSLFNTGGGQNGLDKFSAFGKKIWVTETNNGGGSGSGGTAGNQGEISGMTAMLYDQYYHNNVEAVFAYGLYDDGSGNYGFYANSTTSKPIVASMTAWTASTTGPCSIPIGHRVAFSAASGYYLTENSSNNTFVQANSATTIGLPQYFDAVDSIWQGWGLGQIALWCENTGHYVSVDWQLSGQTDQDTLICNWDTGIANQDSYYVTYIGNNFSSLKSQLTGDYVSCNLSVSDLLMAQYATTPSGWEYLGLMDQGIAPYNPYNQNSYLGANSSTLLTTPNGFLRSGQTLISPNNHAELTMLSTGNLVLYNIEGSPVIKWQSNTAGHTGAYAVMQSDGNFVVYTSTGSPLWASGTSSPSNTNGYLALTSSGNLAVYNQTGGLLWQTGTSF